ncbi:MAG: hypothetical protein ACR2HJ_10585 [Fimbriimonadales bacterium]
MFQSSRIANVIAQTAIRVIVEEAVDNTGERVSSCTMNVGMKKRTWLLPFASIALTVLIPYSCYRFWLLGNLEDIEIEIFRNFPARGGALSSPSGPSNYVLGELRKRGFDVRRGNRVPFMSIDSVTPIGINAARAGVTLHDPPKGGAGYSVTLERRNGIWAIVETKEEYIVGISVDCQGGLASHNSARLALSTTNAELDATARGRPHRAQLASSHTITMGALLLIGMVTAIGAGQSSSDINGLDKPVTLYESYGFALPAVPVIGTPAPAQQPYQVPVTLFAFGGKVYFLDSNDDTLTMVYPAVRREKLSFDVPALAMYRRDTKTEWMCGSSPRAVFAKQRRIGANTRWVDIAMKARIRNALAYGGSLYLTGDEWKTGTTIVRIVGRTVRKSWPALEGLAHAPAPIFFDRARNLLRIGKNGQAINILSASKSPFKAMREFKVSAVASAQSDIFVVVNRKLWQVNHRGRARVTDLTDASINRSDSDGSGAWFLARRRGRLVVAFFTNGKWFFTSPAGLILDGSLLSAAGNTACITWRQGGTEKSRVTLITVTGGRILHVTKRLAYGVFPGKGVAFGGGRWWLSKMDGKGVVWLKPPAR